MLQWRVPFRLDHQRSGPSARVITDKIGRPPRASDSKSPRMTSDFAEMRILSNAVDHEIRPRRQVMAEFRCNSGMTVQVVLLPRAYPRRRDAAAIRRPAAQQRKVTVGSLAHYGSAIQGSARKPSGIVAIKPQTG
jgi:hypothetical protein